MKPFDGARWDDPATNVEAPLREPFLLSTKFYVPQVRTKLVERPRLVADLNRGLQGKLILLSAPAGFGKTTLVSDWLAQLPGQVQVAWLSLDEGDNDPTRFLTYLTAALAKLRKGFGEGIRRALQSPQVILETVLTALVNELVALPFDVVLVLDDYHVIDESVVHEALAFLLEHLPRQVRLVLTSRTAPPPPVPLPLLRVRGQLTELGADDLRFTREEAARFLNEGMGLELSLEEVEALEARTEGWIAALQLAALSLDQAGEMAQAIESFGGSHRYLVDYLTAEVLRGQPPEIQDFLLKTSILDRLEASLANAVTGREDGQAMLEQLESANLFIVPLDARRQWYRYHQVFAEFLHAQMERWVTPEDQTLLHLRASRWYEVQGRISEAVRHALRAGAYERAADLIERVARRLIMHGELVTLERWLDALPGDLLRQRAKLWLARGWILGTGGSDALLLEYLAEADAIVGPENPEALALRVIAMAEHEEAEKTVALAERALAALPEEELFIRGILAFALAVAYLNNGMLAPGFEALEEAYLLGRRAGDLQTALRAAHTLAIVTAIRGDLTRSLDAYRRALELATDESGHRLPVAAMAYVGLSDIYFLLGRDEEAERALREAIDLCKRWGNYEVLVHGVYDDLARIYAYRGDFETARRWLDEAWELAERHALSEETRQILHYREAHVHLLVGDDVEAVARWAERRGLDPSDPLPEPDTFEYLLLTELLLRQGRFEEAGHLLERLEEVERAREWALRLAQIYTLQALRLEALGERAAALQKLTDSLDITAPRGVVSLYYGGLSTLDTLLRAVLEQEIHPAFVRQVLALRQGAVPEAVSVEPDGTVHLLLEPLTEREEEILELLAQGKSNQEIADALVLAVGTVKKHLNNVYGKLNVHSRTAAVARARDLGLLG
jgi:LuxR family maltose regulon positive regulatory protein